MTMLEMGWFSTGRGEGSLGLLNFIQGLILRGELDARIRFVFSNREPGEADGSDRFFRQVESYGIPLVNFSSQRFRKKVGGRFADHRLEYDREVMDRLGGYTTDVCVLAGYMLIIGGEMCCWRTMLNLHPAMPDGPKGTWQEVVWSLIESRADKTGAMVHLSTEDLDRGPVVSYFTVPIVGGPFDGHWEEIEGKSIDDLKETQGEELALFRLIRQEEYRREPYLLGATLNSLAGGAATVNSGRVLGSDGVPIEGGLCLDQEIEAALASS